MVHYIRYLRTPQIKFVNRKTIQVSAVAAVTTDLGDSFLARDVDLITRLVDGTKNKEILSTAVVQWKMGARALKFNLDCSTKYAGRLVYLQITSSDTISSHASCQMPSIVDVFSASFSLLANAKPEPLVERRLTLHGTTQACIWEETGDSIARHIWDASLGCLMYLNYCFEGVKGNTLPSLSTLLTADPTKKLRVLEVGAGCGMVGIALSQLRKAEVVLTDLEDAQDILQCNLDCAKPASGSALQRQVLGWGQDLSGLNDPKFDLILVSDCIYNPDSSILLVETLRLLCEINPSVTILVAFKRRHTADDVFFEHMQKTDLGVCEQTNIVIPHPMTDYDATQPEIEMFVYQHTCP